MIITKTEKYTHIKPAQNSFYDFLNNFKKYYIEFIDQHLIIDFSENFNINIEELTLFLKLSIQHKKNGTSFVLICNDININDTPDEIAIVPTFTEALDILEMDAIERDLGF
ncbi:MAG: hypothetical protein COC16_04255 [Lutibacter sp.]|nr:MAG: hypothetical protein COC16_04255 [Lutibacter sp.]PHS53830.1 MAG: hypothetical protein COB01_03680 [Lutibacter sp.]